MTMERRNKDSVQTTIKASPDKHDLNPTDELNSMLHMKAEIHRLRAEITRLKHLQFQQPIKKTDRERRSSSLSSRPARLQQATKQPTHASDIEIPTTRERHASANGLHHRRHPQEFVSLLKQSVGNVASQEDSLLQSKDMEDFSEDQLESQQRDQQEDESDCDEELSFNAIVMDRAGWLAGLLVLQSLSSFIIQRNEILLQDHAIIVRFLTMLVGAGGNAGNQATVKGTLILLHDHVRCDARL